jgi:hypothetical protein
MAWLKDVLPFLGAVISHEAELLTGGIIMAVITLWSVAKQKQVPRKLMLLIAGVFLFFACFQAWRDERVEKNNLRLSLQDLSTPKLEGFIDLIDVGSVMPPLGPSSVVLMWVRVRNQGMDSIAGGYALQASIDGHEVGPVSPSDIPKNLHFTDLGLSIPGANSGAIYDKTAEHVIPRGGQAAGLLMFLIKGVPVESLTKAGLVYSLRFSDVKDKLYTVSRTMSGTHGNPMNFPGIPGFRPDTRRR